MLHNVKRLTISQSRSLHPIQTRIYTTKPPTQQSQNNTPDPPQHPDTQTVLTKRPYYIPTPTTTPQQPHTTLQSFLIHATSTSLSPTTTVYRGTHYEYTVLNALAHHLQIHTKRVGGAHDLGIDLVGEWRLPAHLLPKGRMHRPLRVFVQCKRTAVTGAVQVRELQGSFVGVWKHCLWGTEGWMEDDDTEGRDVIGFLVTAKEATRGLREALMRSDKPMCHVHCTDEGEIKGMRWNRRAEECGLEGFSVGMRYTQGGGKEARLLYKGMAIEVTNQADGKD